MPMNEMCTESRNSGPSFIHLQVVISFEKPQKGKRTRWHATEQLCHLSFSNFQDGTQIAASPPNHQTMPAVWGVERQGGQTEGCGAPSGARGGKMASGTRQGPVLTQQPATIAGNKHKKFHAHLQETVSSNSDVKVVSCDMGVTTLNSKRVLETTFSCCPEPEWRRSREVEAMTTTDLMVTTFLGAISAQQMRVQFCHWLVPGASLPAILMSGCVR